MAFNKTGWAPAGGQSKRGETVQSFNYKTQDVAATVKASGYFNEVSGSLDTGDLITVLTVDGAGAVVSVGIHVVITNANGVVDVSDPTVLTITNT